MEFTHRGTWDSGAYLSGITDLSIHDDGEDLRLYAVTRAGGGFSAFDLSTNGNTRLIDSDPLPAGFGALGTPSLAIAHIGGDPHLVAAGLTAGFVTVELTGSGRFGARSVDTAPVGTAAMISLDFGGEIRLYSSGNSASGVTSHRLDDATVETLETNAAGRAPASAPATALAAVEEDGRAFILAASAHDDDITLHRLTANGVAVPVDTLGAADGLGIADPTALATATLAGKGFAIVGSAGSSSLSVLRVQSDGSLRATDHVLDTLDTRFQSVAVVETVSVSGRVFVIAGGGDDGLSLLTLLPGGRLLHVGSVADTTETTLDAVSAIAATVVEGDLRIFAAGAETGITEFSVDLGALGFTRTGGGADNTLNGSSQNNVLAGYGGDDRLLGRNGDDILLDGAGQDRLTGGQGADIFVLSADGARDRIMDFHHRYDRLDLSNFPLFYTADQIDWTKTETGGVLRFGDEVLRIDSHNGNTISTKSIKAAIELGASRPPLVLGTGDLEIAGTRSEDVFRGGPGNDRISGAGAADDLDGADGNDRIWGGGGADAIWGGFGNDRVWGDTGADRIWLGAGNDIFRDVSEGGNRGSDRVWGGAGNDQLFGEGGHDQLTGADGKDLIKGGGDNDLLRGGDGNDRIWGGRGNDRVEGGFGNDRVKLGEGRDHYTDTGGGKDQIDGGPGADRIGGAGGDDEIDGGDGADELRGGSGDDRISGGAGADRIEGGDGRDRLRGEGDDDRLLGGNGADILEGGRGEDRLKGGGGNDTFVFRDAFGEDRITGFDKGRDTLRLDDALWSRRLSAEDVVDRFAEKRGGDVVFDFGRDAFQLDGVARLKDLANAIEIF